MISISIRCLMIFLCLNSISYSQRLGPVNKAPHTEIYQALKVGDIVPETVMNFLTKNEDIELVILDFWGTGCSTCIDAFPKMEEIQSVFKGRVKVILANNSQSADEIEEKLGNINKNKKALGRKLINLPKLDTLNQNSFLQKLFPYKYLPHHVWIKRGGEVLAITSGLNTTLNNIRLVLEGNKVDTAAKYDLMSFNYKQGLLRPTYPEFSFAVFSGFMPYLQNVQIPGASMKYVDSMSGLVKLHLTNQTMVSFYRMAFSVPPNRIFLDLENRQDFSWPKDVGRWDKWQRQYLFSYEIAVQLSDEQMLKEYMKSDVNKFFGKMYGVIGMFEKRKINCFILVQKKMGLLGSKGGKRMVEANHSKIHFQNSSFTNFAGTLSHFLDDLSKPEILLNDVKYEGNVDIDLQVDKNNLGDLNRQLDKYGLEIKRRKREVVLFVIKKLN